jgi:hypothetical protein
MDNKQWLMKLATFKNTTTESDELVETANENTASITLIVVYGLVIISGIFGNVTLLVTLCSQSSSRLRNPLLLALCLADLLITAVAAPWSLVNAWNGSWSIVNASCKAFHYVQVSSFIPLQIASNSFYKF